MQYDFSQLNDKEFEEIVSDLLSCHFGKRVEQFKRGKDKGVDGRFFSNNGGENVIQCKHYLNSGYKKLLSVLKKSEREKVVKLNPESYFFITSVPLSRIQKNEIEKIFSPFIKSPSDVYGPSDLNQLLGKFPEVEKKHFKLWLSSTTVLTAILNQAISARSSSELDKIKEKSALFVFTADYYVALKHLKEKQVVILSGEPGVGKTTLANNIALFYAAKGFEFFFIEESISEAEAVFKPGKKQIFYFDDFLGSNYLEAIEYKKDSHIMSFIDRIRRDKKKRFILTSRTNILNQGIKCSPAFINRKLKSSELLLKVSDLSDMDKAMILYNHIWHRYLPENFIDVFYQNRQYRALIGHKNFNPRLVEFITDQDRLFLWLTKITGVL